ncbi:DUF3035 domain-containing protein [Sphingomonas colocasiae]|uniref:DUF3035 domain-containing protein n=1 Tax=Sphingomonas colocasiae TaxID=1848973 RepID=A0ABS7PXG3_9SPHN|nr:DUF3035 domain-containing protein [Sphingomonas colocasiae]MBY8825903.1 DUF3035 domain-containing protein [Sphingomonas colocasiae]
MRKPALIATLGMALAGLSACGSSGYLDRERPDEFAVTRNAPLVIPPDFALVPPAPGAPRAVEADSSTQALQAMFGGPSARSAAESGVVSQAGGARSSAGIRSDVGDPKTDVVDKGAVTRDIIAAPEGDGQDARAKTPQ